MRLFFLITISALFGFSAFADKPPTIDANAKEVLKVAPKMASMFADSCVERDSSVTKHRAKASKGQVLDFCQCKQALVALEVAPTIDFDDGMMMLDTGLANAAAGRADTICKPILLYSGEK